MERIGFQDVPKGYYDPIFQIGTYLKKTGLDYKLMELVRYRVAQLNGCAFCLDMHYKELRHAKETELRLSALTTWEETPYFSELERSVLKYAESLTLLSENTAIRDEIFDSLKKHFSQDQIADLTMVIIEINCWSRFMKAFRVTPGNYKVGMFD